MKLREKQKAQMLRIPKEALREERVMLEGR